MSLKIIKKFGKYFNLRTISDSKTGEIATEVTDASASGIYDVKKSEMGKRVDKESWVIWR